jgi:N-acetylmuramate 1-kinase
LFPDWYVAKHLGKTLDRAQQAAWDGICDALVERAIGQEKVFVHRDYMPRNLMVSTPNPGVLDFQDATYGPISYDVISLYRDAFISWEEEFVLDGVIRYWEAARKAKLPVPDEFGEFYKDCEWMGLQRHLKIMGIFARIQYRDGKPKYLADTPRFAKYIRDVAKRYVALAPLYRLFDSLGIVSE